jgi:hypothetical protein
VCLLVGATVASWGRFAGLLALLKTNPLSARNVTGYASANWAATLSNLFAGLAFHSSALATGFLGPFAGPWAGVVRIAGGFAGISQQVVSPPYDMRLSSAIRIESTTEIRRVIVTTAILGLAMAVLAYIAVWVAFLIGAFVRSRTLALGDSFSVLLIGGAYTFGVLVPSICSKFLVMLGHQQPHFLWAVSKFVVISVALVLFRGIVLLAALAVLEFLAAIAYLCLLMVYRRRPGKAHQQIEVSIV